MTPIRAHGKVILFGEHAVVYGRPALAVAIRDAVVLLSLAPRAKGIRVTVDPWGLRASDESRGPVGRALRTLSGLFAGSAGFEAGVSARIPAGAGLGSSAALAAVLVRALAATRGAQPDDDQVRAGVHAIETTFHGRPSGLDGALATLGGVCLFRRSGPDEAGPGVAECLPLDPPPLVVGFSGVSRFTGAMVEQVRRRRGGDPRGVEACFDAIEGCLETGLRAWRAGDLAALGRAMTANHEALRGLGVSTPELDAMVEAALRAGALGAKLTGAGGGGCVMALAPGREDEVVSAWHEAGFLMFSLRMGGPAP